VAYRQDDAQQGQKAPQLVRSQRVQRQAKSLAHGDRSAPKSTPAFPRYPDRAVPTRGIAPTLPMGITPKQTSNLLYLRRMRSSSRSLVYRRVEQRFAISVYCTLTPGAV